MRWADLIIDRHAAFDLPITLSAPGVDAQPQIVEKPAATAQWWHEEQAAKAKIQDACGGAARICDGVLVT